MDKIQQNIQPIKPQLTDQQKARLKAAAKDFEAVFTEYMLKTMEQTENVDGQGEGQGYGKDIMTGLFNTEMAKYMSNNSNLGIGNILYKQFTGEDMDSGSDNSAKSLSNLTSQMFATDPAKLRVLEKIKTYSSGSLLENVGKYSDIVNEASATYDLKPNLINAVIAAESSGNADSLSTENAKGLMQLLDSTSKDMGVTNPFDPRENIMGGAKYLKGLLEKFSGDVNLALASYNAGPGAVEQYGGVPPYTETQNYVKRVLGYMKMFDSSEATDVGK